MKVRRANVVLTVTENEMEKYLARGFTILDDSGKVIKKPIPNDVNALRKAYIEHEAEIAKLKAKIEQLEAQTKTEVQPKRNTRAKKVEE